MASNRNFILFLRVAYTLLACFLLVYSYTQVDLGLTLTQQSVAQTIQTSLQHVGYFLRPLSTVLYLVLLVVLFLLYGVSLYEAKRGFINKRDIWSIILPFTGIVMFSYPAFSYDLFNYMFDAKTILVYHKIPYEVIPLQFTGVEPWLSFLHWTHISSIYSPVWLIMSLVPYLFGFGYFLFIMWNFKILMALAFLTVLYCIPKILRSDNKEEHIGMGMVLYACNPLIIIETLVSGHNDIVMMAFLFIGLALYGMKKRVLGFLFYCLSVSTKWMTLFLLPGIVSNFQKKLLLFISMAVGLVVMIVYTKREILPWYFIWFIPLVSLIPESKVLRYLVFGSSLGLLLRYAPFLYFGHWNEPVPTYILWSFVVSFAVSLMFYGVSYAISHKKGR